MNFFSMRVIELLRNIINVTEIGAGKMLISFLKCRHGPLMVMYFGDGYPGTKGAFINISMPQ